SAEKVIKALQSQSAAIEADYAKFPTTIGNALQKISTQWQILIGEMDQANGSSATVAKALSTIADNLGILKLFFDDVAEGVGYFTSKFDDIDPSTLNALRDTLTQVYENIKLNIKYVADFGETAWSAFTSALDAVSPLFNALIGGGEDVNGFTTFLNMLRMAMAAVSDASFGLNVGLKILLSSVQFLAGGVYSLASATLKYVPFMGDLADEAEKASDRMFAQAEKNMQGAIQLSTEHKWAVVETYEDIRKTQKEKNEEAVADSTATFADLVKQNQEFSQKSKDLAGERAAIDAQLNQARKDGNQSTIDAIIQKSNELESREKEHATNKAALDKDMLASAQDYAEAAIKANGGVMDGVMQADLLTQGYIVTMDEAGKVSVQASQSAEQAAESAAKKEEALRLAKENVKKADEEYLAYQKQAAAERAILEQQIEQAKKTGDLNALASAQSSINAINAKEAELANNRDLRIAELNKANTGSGQVAETAYSRASAAAKLFGVDLDVSLNKVSKSFSSSGNELDGLKTKL
ncbi:tape measure domain-containing protein, partial [Salmonella enterica]|nr:tape measure domain-containing protein [Salmonella enterica]